MNPNTIAFPGAAAPQASQASKTSKSTKSEKFGHLNHEDIRTIIRQLQELLDDIIVGSKTVNPNYPIAFGQNFIPSGSLYASKVSAATWPLVELLEEQLVEKLKNEPNDLHNYDVELIGILANRVTFAVGNDITVKMAFNNFGRIENKHEQSVWTKASADLKTVLAPVKASSTDGAWLIMEACEPYPVTGNYPEWLKNNAEDAKDLGLTSPYELNDNKLWGVLNSETVLVEYGFTPKI